MTKEEFKQRFDQESELFKMAKQASRKKWLKRQQLFEEIAASDSYGCQRRSDGPDHQD